MATAHITLILLIRFYMEQIQQTAVYHKPGNDLFRKRHSSTICFIIGLLLFLLPFAEFKCGNIPVVANTGIGIATGQNWKFASSFGNTEWMGKLNESKKTGKDTMNDGPNIFAIAALVAGLFGAGIAFANVSWRSMAGMCAGILAAVMMLAVMIQFKISMRSLLNKGSTGDDFNFNMGGIIKIQFTIWYWLSLVSFIAAAFINYMRDKIALREAMELATDFEFQKDKSTAVL